MNSECKILQIIPEHQGVNRKFILAPDKILEYQFDAKGLYKTRKAYKLEMVLLRLLM